MFELMLSHLPEWPESCPMVIANSQAITGNFEVNILVHITELAVCK